MTPQSFDDDASPWKELAREHSDAPETRVLTVTFPQRIWFRLDRFMRCEGGLFLLRLISGQAQTLD